jgi:glycosyltransferase involved in cell wall biosynthesis
MPPARPTITIVTPAYNAAGTIGDTIASVRDQDYPGLEHIVVDGGSTDGTLDILRDAPGVRWISEPDLGLADAMNKGIAMATGDVLGELNADDVYAPGALRAVAEGFASHPRAEWLTGRCAIIDGAGQEIRRGVTAYKNALLRRYSFGLYLTHNFVSAPATFFRTEVMRELGGFDLRYTASLDYDLQLKFARRGDPVVVDRELARFRMVEGTISMSSFEHQFREHAQQARKHGDGHRVAVTANRVVSRAIVLAYSGMRRARRSSASPS